MQYFYRHDVMKWELLLEIPLHQIKLPQEPTFRKKGVNFLKVMLGLRQE